MLLLFFYINLSHHRLPSPRLPFSIHVHFLHTPPSKLPFHFDVGAYGIPKFRPSNVICGRDGVGGAELWSHMTEGLDLAVQMGEDAYFVRDNAMGVADGVGGWSRIRVLCASSSHSWPIYPWVQIPRKVHHLRRRS